MTALTKEHHYEVRGGNDFRKFDRHGAPQEVYFIARAEPGKQKLLHRGLLHRGIGFVAHVITESRRCGRRGMRKFERFYAPGYSFVRLENEAQRDMLSRTPGFQSLMRAGPERYFVLLPAAMSLIERVALSTVEEKAKLPFASGEFVRVVDAPFASFPGKIEEIPHKDRIKVGVDIFGRSTPVELDAWQVEKLVK